MITVGLSWHELERITKVLDEHSLHYNVDAQDDGEDKQKAALKKGARGSSAFYQIDIPDAEYNKLPSSARLKLEGLGIYPEMEMPQFEEAHVEVAQKTIVPPTSFQKFMKYAFPIACALLILSYLKRMF
jgi:hypothetical protein